MKNINELSLEIKEVIGVVGEEPIRVQVSKEVSLEIFKRGRILKGRIIEDSSKEHKDQVLDLLGNNMIPNKWFCKDTIDVLLKSMSIALGRVYTLNSGGMPCYSFKDGKKILLNRKVLS